MDDRIHAHLREIKDDIIQSCGVRFDGIDARLDKVNGRLDTHGAQIGDARERLGKVEQQATNLDREVFTRNRRDVAKPSETDGLAIKISEGLLRKIATPKTIGYIVGGLFVAIETIGHLKEWLAPLFAKQ